MTPKEQAEDLIDKYTFAEMYFVNGKEGVLINAKFCSLIHVEELIKELLNCDCLNQVNWYKEVKEELLKR